MYWAPEAMVFKHAIVQTVSVAEAVLQYGLKMIEDDPRVQAALGTDWVWVDWKEIPLPGIVLPAGQRAVTGLQRVVEKEQLDRNSKKQVLIRASRKAGILEEELANEVDELRKQRSTRASVSTWWWVLKSSTSREGSGDTRKASRD